MQSFYIDSCIYLNLWKREKGLIFGEPLWLIAKRFFNKIMKQNSIIYYSGFVLKEIEFILSLEEFNKKAKFFDYYSNLYRLKLTEDEFKLARKIEKKINYMVGFYDIIHMILTKRTKSILITRDKNLIEIASKFGVIAKRPEEAIH